MTGNANPATVLAHYQKMAAQAMSAAINRSLVRLTEAQGTLVGAIMATPTSLKRDKLTDINIRMMEIIQLYEEI